MPTREDYKTEYVRLEKLAAEQRKSGKQIVVVVGLGFVGAVMALSLPPGAKISITTNNSIKVT